MISMNCLGAIGRLGNQMFQYAALRSISKKHNYEYCLPINPRLGNEDLNLFDCFLLDNEVRANTNFYKIVLEDLGFDENIFYRCPDNVDLHGYFQDVRYIQNNSEDIKRCFTFIPEIFQIANNTFQSCFSNQEVISLHIRRGDYFHWDHNVIHGIEYYSEALKFFDDDIKVLIFSDDIDWAHQQQLFTGDRFFFSRNNNNAVDLCLQTLCNYHIIANSSFSWWGAWLANSNRVIKPRIWFNENEDLLDVDHWISL